MPSTTINISHEELVRNCQNYQNSNRNSHFPSDCARRFRENHHSSQIKINLRAIIWQLAMGCKRAVVPMLICQTVCGIMQSRNLRVPGGIASIKVNLAAIFDTFRPASGVMPQWDGLIVCFCAPAPPAGSIIITPIAYRSFTVTTKIANACKLAGF